MHKRRRLDDALHRPFRSPLKQQVAPFETEQMSGPALQSESNDSAADVDAPVPTFSLNSSTLSMSSQHIKSVLVTGSTLAAASQESYYSPIPTYAVITNSGTDIITTRALEMQIRDMRAEIDTLQQARRTLSSKRDIELKQLTQKWKTATRLVIEELFGVAVDKVNRIGGVQAWRGQEQRWQDRKREWAITDMEEELDRALSESESDEEDDVDEMESGEDKSAKRERRDKAWEARQAKKEMRAQVREDATSSKQEAAEEPGDEASKATAPEPNNDDVSIGNLIRLAVDWV